MGDAQKVGELRLFGITPLLSNWRHTRSEVRSIIEMIQQGRRIDTEVWDTEPSFESGFSFRMQPTHPDEIAEQQRLYAEAKTKRLAIQQAKEAELEAEQKKWLRERKRRDEQHRQDIIDWAAAEAEQNKKYRWLPTMEEYEAQQRTEDKILEENVATVEKILNEFRGR